MQELQKDPKVIRAARAHLVPGETILWACAQHVLGRRGLLVLGATLTWYFAIWTAMVLMAGGPLGALVFPMSLTAPFLFWWLVEMMARAFIATDRRVIFISRVWPFRWSYWNYAEMNEHLVRVGLDRNIIHFDQFNMHGRGVPNWVYNLSVYPTYVENVHDIESVRDLILAGIAQKPAPVEDAGKPSENGPRPTVHGTRTG